MSDNTLESLLNGDGRPTSRHELAELIRRLRHAAAHLPADATPRDDLKILSQTLRELRRAFTVFAPYRSQRKVTVFGSARTPRDAPAYEAAVQLGKSLAAHGWFVVTGASTGIMEAGHRGAGRERSMGLNIMLPFEQAANEIIRDDSKLVTMKYFFTRKLMFVKECDAVVCLPGGFGTLDEAFEVLTLMQTGKRELMPLVFLDAPGGSFWQDWLKYVRRHLLDGGMISPEDLSLFRVTDSVEETVDEILQFYRVFDRMEYVHNQLVLHLKEAIATEKLNGIQRDFADILIDGDFRQEINPPGSSRRSQLVFHFNRRSLGRLRELINELNGPPGQ